MINHFDRFERSGRFSDLIDDLESATRHLASSCTSPDLVWTQTDAAYTLEVPLAGYKRSEVDVEVLPEGVLSLCATRAGCKAFNRSFYLPDDADPTMITAKMEDGLLTVTVAKVTRPAARKVTVA